MYRLEDPRTEQTEARKLEKHRDKILSSLWHYDAPRLIFTNHYTSEHQRL